jgi:hypothetical protein
MKKLLMLAVLTLTAAPLYAQEPREKPSAASRFGAGLRQWFLHVKEGLTESSVSSQRQKARITAVAAVRGAEQGEVDPAAPVWKSASGAKKAKATKKERAELAAAVDSALAGDLDGANAKLDAFEAAHEGSLLLTEAKEIRAKLKEAQAASEPATQVGSETK